MTLLQSISDSLQLPPRYLERLASQASHHYKSYQIPKRSGGVRIIHHPSKELKAIQRWLLQAVVSRFPVHRAAMAYRPGVSIRANALAHASSKFLLRLDLESFFPSIGEQDVAAYLRDSWDEADIDVFIAFVCRFGRLTIGAPTSPALSNAVCHEMDSRLDTLVEREGVTYTRYADDMFFSTRRENVLWDTPKIVKRTLNSLPFPTSLSLNESKTRHSSRRGRRQVTGLVITPDGRITIGRDKKRAVRARIHKLENLSAEQRDELAGYLAFARSVEPDFINALILKYGKARVDAARAGT